MVSAEGGEVRQLTDAQDRVAYANFACSPEGVWVAYVSADKEIRLLPLQGGENRVVTRVESAHFHRELSWSPDASEIAYAERGRIMVVSIQDGRLREVETGILTKKSQNFHLDWSPDGKKLAFSAQLGGEPEFWFIKDFLP
jgi:Tol biopolymer transport system component